MPFPSSIISIPLTQQAHHFAKQFASEQKTLDKAKQVYHNTLAVVAANTFLSQWMQIETVLEESDSWDFLIRYYQNVADLVIQNLGKVECQILPSEMKHLQISELAEDVFAYVAVQLDDSLSKAYLLGFIPSVDLIHLEQPVSLDNLQSIISLADYILFLEAGKDFLESRDSLALQFNTFLQSRCLSNVSIIASLEYFLRNESQLNLDEHLRKILTDSDSMSQSQKPVLSETDLNIAKQFLARLTDIWNIHNSVSAIPQASEEQQTKQPLSDFFQSVLTFRSEIEYLGNWLLGKSGVGWEPVFRSSWRGSASAPNKRRKLIQLGEIAVELVVTVIQNTEQELAINFEVRPESDLKEIRFAVRNYLPQGLEMQVLDESQTVFLSEIAGEREILLKIPSEEEFIKGVLGERCSIKLNLNNNSVTEEFILDFS